MFNLTVNEEDSLVRNTFCVRIFSLNLWCLYRPFIRDQKQINPYSLLSLSTERVCVKPENYRPYLSVNSKQWPIIADVGSK